MSQKKVAFYGLPEEVKFCKRCVMSNQKPNSAQEFKHKLDDKKSTLDVGEDGICSACRIAELKEGINWEQREAELHKLLDKHRKSDGSYDCLIPGSGGKDSAYQAHVLKYKYGMNPLTVTWPPIMYTDYGYENFKQWLDIGGFDNISYNRNGRVLKLLTKLSIENLLHPFQTFILGQMNMAPKLAANFGINLIFYGENPTEYGNNIAEDSTSLKSKSYFSMDKIDDIYLGGVSVRELKEKYNITHNDLIPYLPIKSAELDKVDIQVHYLGYYLKWTPQEVYYYAVENTGFKARPFRSQGTYSKYSSIDDKIDDLHYYTTFVKFGLGRATYDASQEIRNKHLTREEGQELVKRFDGEFPDRYFDEVMEYLDINPDFFKGELLDRFRSPHLWGKDSSGNWKLRHNVWGGGLDD
jgi:N-acetyl sugar amidotransferase